MKNKFPCVFFSMIFIYSETEYTLANIASHEDKQPLSRNTYAHSDQGPVSRTSRKLFGPEKPFQKPRSLWCTELFMSAGLEFTQSLNLCNVSNLRIFLVFQLRSFKVGFSGPKTFRGFRETGPRSAFLRHTIRCGVTRKEIAKMLRKCPTESCFS